MSWFPFHGKGREEISGQLCIALACAGKLLDRFRRHDQQRSDLVEGYGARPKIAAPPGSQSTRPNGTSSWPVAAMLRILLHSVREGFHAHRRYEELKSKGIPHDTAIRQALGISRERS